MGPVDDRGNGKITLPPGAIVVELPRCPYCHLLITACKCGSPTPRKAA